MEDQTPVIPEPEDYVVIEYTLLDQTRHRLIIEMADPEKFNFRLWFNNYMTKCDGWFPLSDTKLVSHKNLLAIAQIEEV